MKQRSRATTTAIVTVTAVLIGVLAVAVAPADASGADRSASSYYSLINDLRASHGLGPLAIDNALAGSAQSWAQHMADTGTLSHDPALGSAVSGWTKLGENVGTGPNVDQIWQAFLRSPGHLDNLLDPAFTHMGVGFVIDGTSQYTTHRFMTKAGSAATTPSPTAPPVTASPTTAAPTPTAPPPTAPPITVPANPGDTVDCADFSGWAEANQWFTYHRPYYGDVALLDPDSDGIPCETSAGAPYQPPLVTAAPTYATGGVTPTTSPSMAGSGSSGSGSSGSAGEEAANGAASDGAATGSTGGSGSGSDPSSAETPADPDRVAEVITALRAIES